MFLLHCWPSGNSTSEVAVFIQLPAGRDWELKPEGSRRSRKDGKKNDILRDPEGCQYTRHHSKQGTWKCTHTLINSKQRCNQQVREIADGEGNVVGYEYDPKTEHGKHRDRS